jgi:hypothetical protein
MYEERFAYAHAGNDSDGHAGDGDDDVTDLQGLLFPQTIHLASR